MLRVHMFTSLKHLLRCACILLNTLKIFTHASTLTPHTHTEKFYMALTHINILTEEGVYQQGVAMGQFMCQTGLNHDWVCSCKTNKFLTYLVIEYD